MSDLKLLDEVLCLYQLTTGKSWAEIESGTFIMGEALNRLRQSWQSDRMPLITASLADYFSGPAKRGAGEISAVSRL